MTRLDEGALAERNLPDGRNLCVYPLVTGTARLVVSRDDKVGCYETTAGDSLPSRAP